ncbi:tRNA synthetases class II-domain-containing protein [Epithele typhae]|uniref:tRNA synthetases class II-domain-containing protein n=1 Tax=Epithele typhae TaxID=378194 RepID=UPI0020081206|nr:tRNA synthetases class II-domain-containing protein [Epithele typhae]KAH9943112.1 tRNA synthetases class II-domain-containing protein [Epithele typhae]
MEQVDSASPYPTRTHTCGGLDLVDVDKEVVLMGWLVSKGKLGKKLSFYGLRDSHGTAQLIMDARVLGEDNLAAVRAISPESTVLVRGLVVARPESQRRSERSGSVEVSVKSFILLNPAGELPFSPHDPENLANEDLRLRYRYLDLRRAELTANLKKRSEVAYLIKDELRQAGFGEVETPMLLNSTPEGAREYLVPTRVKQSPGAPAGPQFYALSQSPQQPKQLLVVSGAVDRYYQFARCFRDEDGRKDRQPEFTQVDLEMAWVNWGHATRRPVRDVVERVIRRVWHEIEGVDLPERFRVMTYDEAMRKYGSDKPDLRFGLEIIDLTCAVPSPLREELVANGEVIEALAVNAHDDHRPFLAVADDVEVPPEVKRYDDPGSEWKQIYNLVNGCALEPGKSVVWTARRPKKPDFPLFTRADADKDFLAHGRWSATHHPFTAPMAEDVALLRAGDVAAVRGQHYDLVLNGVEVGGGSVRIHDAALQTHVMRDVLQLTEEELVRFGHLLHALTCGAPPHGFDRLMAMLCNSASIRDVIAFPKTAAGTDLLFKSPSPSTADVLAQYGLSPKGSS